MEDDGAMKKSAKPYEQTGFAIINPHGDVWSPEIFNDDDAVRRHLDRFWGGRAKWKDFDFRIAPATSTVTVTGPERVKLK
jgi:hypothetical protein